VATAATFLAKFIFALTFLIPVLFFELSRAVIISIIWGLSALSLFSYRMAREQHKHPLKVVGEHLGIAIVVIVATYYVGTWVSTIFK